MTDQESVNMVVLSITLALVGAGWVGFRYSGRFAPTDWGRQWMNRLAGVNFLFCRHYHRFHWERIELPNEGPALLVSNHLSGLDPLLLLAAARRPLRFVIAMEEYQRWWLRWLLDLMRVIPVDRSSRPEQAFYAARKALESGDVVVIFPQGRMQRPNEGKIPLKRGAAFLAAWSNVHIYPVRLSGIHHLGGVFRPLVARSHSKLSAGSPMVCEKHQQADCIEELSKFFYGDDGS